MSQEKDQTIERLKDYRECADRLFAIAGTHAIAEAARALAIDLGYYQRRYGPIAISASPPLLSSQTLTAEQVADLTEGMRCLAAALTLATAIHSGTDTD